MNTRKRLKTDVFINMALEIAKLGTCCRAKVGCILLREDGSVAGAGYNGAPPGMEHCTDETCNSENRCIHTSHAEENALFFSHGDVKHAFITHEPCLACTRMLVRRGIRNIYFRKSYTSMPERERNERDAVLRHFKVVCWQV